MIVWRNGLASEEDFIVSGGLPFLAHRLRRASEQLVEAAAVIQRNSGFTGPPKSISTLLLLEEEGPLGITEISNRLSLSHPLIIRFVRGLAAEGYVTHQRDPKDARRRLVSLTDKGRRHVAYIRGFMPVLAETFRRLFQDMGVDLYSALEKFELAISERPLVDRLREAGSQTTLR
jgi:DNA-binding MarR family transcriptional regulator